MAAERTLLLRLEGGCQLPFGVNIDGGGSSWRLEAFLARDADDDAPLRLSLEGTDPDSMAEEAWRRIQAHREG